jgi:hypothetical protein
VRPRLIRMLLPALHPAAHRLQPAVTRPTLLIRRPLARSAERTCRRPRRFSRCWDCSDSAPWWLAFSSAGSYKRGSATSSSF